MCSFCEKIYSLKDETLPRENCISYDKVTKQFDIWAAAGDPYDTGILQDVKFCPYCGEKMIWKGENDEENA